MIVTLLFDHCLLLMTVLGLDSEFTASTSTDGSSRIWKTEDGAPVTTLTRNSDEKIELCRFSNVAWDKPLPILHNSKSQNGMDNAERREGEERMRSSSEI